MTSIELRVERVASLFDTLDPFPIPTRDLSRSAEDFIVGWARELPTSSELRIVVHLPPDEAAQAEEASLADALHTHFAGRARAVQGDLKHLFRVGRLSLLIGIAVLALCVLAAQLTERWAGDGALGHVLGEGLLILGWVANWRPIEIFLYDWWPLVSRRRLMERLSVAQVSIKVVGAS